MNFLIFAWAATFFFGLVNVVGKLTSKYAIKNIWFFNFLHVLFPLLITIPLAVGNHVGFPTHWGNLILAGIFNALFNILFVLSIYHLDISILNPLFSFRTGFGTILAVLVLGETLNVTQILLIGLIFVAGMFVSLDEKFSIKSFFKKPIFYGLLMTFSLAIMSIFISKAVKEVGFWETNLYNPLIAQILMLFTIPLFIKEVKKTNRMQILGMAAMALFLALANILANKAYATNVSISTAIMAVPMSMIIVFILALVKPGLLEKHTLKVYAIRFAAAFTMIGSALLLSK
jgi:drug/metabolite transporter (DMT)-like permease